MPTNPLLQQIQNYLPQPIADYQYTHGSQSLQSDYANMRAAVIQSQLSGGYDPQAARAAMQPYNAAHTVGHTSLLGRIGNAFNYDQRKGLLMFGAGMLGGAAGAGVFGGAGAAGAGGGTGALGAGAGAATVNPFAASAGLSTNWAPIAGAGLSANWAPIAGASAAGAAGGAGSLAPTVAGAGGGGLGTAAAAGTPWYNTMLGQTGINTGLNLLGGYLNNRAIGNAQNQSQQQIADRIRQALAALSPAQIMALAQQFLPQMAAMMSQQGQTAVQAVREQAARTGQLENPRALSFEAGTRAKLAGDVQQRAFEAAFNTAGAQAGAITGAPYTPIQPQMGYADAIMNSVNQAYMARALQQQQQPGTPYRWPGQNPYYPWEAGG